MELSDDTLRALTKSISDYFSKYKLGVAETLAPYLGEHGVLPCLQWTGVIYLTGSPRGIFYLTIGDKLAHIILNKMMLPTDDKQIRDTVWEMANVFAGNLGAELGSAFEIEPPFTFKGASDAISYNVINRAYILPFKHAGETANVVIAFNEG